MPKKAAKRAGKKSAKTPKSMPIAAAKIFAETSFATAQGMERQMATVGRPYALDAQARDFWLAKHAITIPKANKNPKNKWNVLRRFVLPQAQQLGMEAATNAINDPANAGPGGITVTKQHVEAASLKIAHGAACVAARTTPKGGGPYCPE